MPTLPDTPSLDEGLTLLSVDELTVILETTFVGDFLKEQKDLIDKHAFLDPAILRRLLEYSSGVGVHYGPRVVDVVSLATDFSNIPLVVVSGGGLAAGIATGGLFFILGVGALGCYGLYRVGISRDKRKMSEYGYSMLRESALIELAKRDGKTWTAEDISCEEVEMTDTPKDKMEAKARPDINIKKSQRYLFWSSAGVGMATSTTFLMTMYLGAASTLKLLGYVAAAATLLGPWGFVVAGVAIFLMGIYLSYKIYKYKKSMNDLKGKYAKMGHDVTRKYGKFLREKHTSPDLKQQAVASPDYIPENASVAETATLPPSISTGIGSESSSLVGTPPSRPLSPRPAAASV